MHPDVYWDLRRGVPFPDECAQAAFLEHVLEHFSLGDVVAVLKECHRVLAPGGIVRIGVPDFGRYLESYSGDRSFIEELRPGRPTPLLAVGEVALNHGHRSVWDGPTLVAVLEEAGFVEARRRSTASRPSIPCRTRRCASPRASTPKRSSPPSGRVEPSSSAGCSAHPCRLPSRGT